MIPVNTILTEEITEDSYVGRTYKIVVNESNENRISGYVDDLESVKQAIYLILSTERYAYIIYSWDYGIELVDLFGKPISYVMSELQERIDDALTQDDRIESVDNFEFEISKNRIHTTFTVNTTVGNFDTELEVTV